MMEYMTPDFTQEMAATHTILIPNMAPVQFSLLQAALDSEGYHTVLLSSGSSEAARLGLKYVHNDTCYPALVVIGQFLEALDSGEYDLEHTALMITQTGGGCRASNYLKLLRKALVKSGYGYIPVISVNFSGLEKNSSLHFTPELARKVFAAVEYGDELSALRNQVRPYESNEGDTEKLTGQWIRTITQWMKDGTNYKKRREIINNFERIAESYSRIPVRHENKIKVGIVGEIYVKFSPIGNNNLLAFLESQGCEVNLPGLMGFLEYSIANTEIDYKLYGGKWYIGLGAETALNYLDAATTAMNDAMRKYGFTAPGRFRELMKKPEGILHLGAKMGEGWLLTAEMVELIESGFTNIVCAQPFGCLPNHIAGKGVMSRIRSLYPEANITAVDYDASSSRVNQENRIKLMLSVAAEKLNGNKPAESY